MNITSWFGVGSTIKLLKENHPEKYQLLKQLLKSDPFVRYILTNVDSGLAATDPDIIRKYASLVEEDEIRNDILPMILDEYFLTKELLAEMLQRPFEERRVNHYYSTRLRAVALDLMHRVQIDVLKRWRGQKETGITEVSNQQNILLLKTINAVANALGSTG
jgi:phosphoenolpyruvate carboxylase